VQFPLVLLFLATADWARPARPMVALVVQAPRRRGSARGALLGGLLGGLGRIKEVQGGNSGLFCQGWKLASGLLQ
jgi:hypothetical protein